MFTVMKIAIVIAVATVSAGFVVNAAPRLEGPTSMSMETILIVDKALSALRPGMPRVKVETAVLQLFSTNSLKMSFGKTLYPSLFHGPGLFVGYDAKDRLRHANWNGTAYAKRPPEKKPEPVPIDPPMFIHSFRGHGFFPAIAEAPIRVYQGMSHRSS
jgi:hypothetical protein